MIAAQQGRGLAALAEDAGAAVLSGSRLKVALDLDWDDPVERAHALELILATLEALEAYSAAQVSDAKTARV